MQLRHLTVMGQYSDELTECDRVFLLLQTPEFGLLCQRSFFE